MKNLIVSQNSSGQKLFCGVHWRKGDMNSFSAKFRQNLRSRF